MKKLLFIFTLLTLSVFSQPLIPADRRITWSRDNCGVPGGIPNRQTIFCNPVVNIPGSGLLVIPDGVTDNTAALNAAIANCPSNQVVFLPAGDYNFTGIIQWHANGVTLRGAGPKSTILHVNPTDPSHDFIDMGGFLGDGGNSVSVISGLTQGSTNVVVADATRASQLIGNTITIFFFQGTDPDTVHRLTVDGSAHTIPGDPNNIISLTANVTAVNLATETITFWPPLVWTMTGTPQAYTLIYGRGCYFSGIEDLGIKVEQNCNFNIFMERCYGCWVKNIDSSNTVADHIILTHSVLCEIRDNYIHDFLGGGGGNNGEGIDMFLQNTGILVENNIVVRCFPQINTSSGSDGCFVGYNFCGASHSGTTIIGNDFDSNHGAHNVMNLWEGNAGCMFQSDGFYGSCSHITVFRNYFSGTHLEGLTMHQICIDLTHWQNYFNIIGNVLGSPGWSAAGGLFTTEANNYSYFTPVIYRFGYPGLGNNNYSNSSVNPVTGAWNDLDLGVKTTVLTNYNYNYFNNAVPDGVTNLPPSLFYTNGSPPWWPASVSFPPIGPDLAIMTNQIPAQLRFFSGNFNGGPPAPPTHIKISGSHAVPPL